ncbi:YsnF/AvaK domain-containing protein [Myxococcaceae bacterium GXIMD 01537]
MFERSSIQEGMIVRSIDGEKLGKVFAIGEDSFQIERGLFFPKDFLVRYADVSDVRNGEIILSLGKDNLERLGGEERASTTYSSADTSYAATDTSGIPTGAPVAGEQRVVEEERVVTETSGATVAPLRPAEPFAAERTMEAGGEDITVPLYREELDVSKHDKQTGEVRVHKEIVEEEKVMDVPVRRERVRVERRKVTSEQPAMSASFQEETVVVPLHAEEVEITKRAMLDEEVVIHKDAIEEERHVQDTLRRERVDIRSDADVEEGRKLTLSGESEDTSKTRY